MLWECNNKFMANAKGYQLMDANNTVVSVEKVILIGDWNMDNDATKSVAHGLDVTKIFSITSMIRNDDDTSHYPLTRGAAGTPVDGSIESIDATNVNLARSSSGAYDGTDFDSTSYNRGWIQIEYII